MHLDLTLVFILSKNYTSNIIKTGKETYLNWYNFGRFRSKMYQEINPDIDKQMFALDPEVKKKINEHFERLLKELIEKPENVGESLDRFYQSLLGIFAITDEDLKRLFELIDEGKRKALKEKLTSLEFLILMISPEEIDNKISMKISELIEICLKKDVECLKEIYSKSRIELFRKILLSFKRSWMSIRLGDIPKSASMDSKVRIIKSLSEGIYYQLLLVIQEMMQIAFDYKPVSSFGGIIDQLEKNPYLDMSVLVNRRVKNIRNSEAHEDLEIGKSYVVLYDRNGKEIEKLTEEDLDEAIEWLITFTRSIFSALQKSYFNVIGIKPKDRTDYMISCLLSIFLEDF